MTPIPKNGVDDNHNNLPSDFEDDQGDDEVIQKNKLSNCGDDYDNLPSDFEDQNDDEIDPKKMLKQNVMKSEKVQNENGKTETVGSGKVQNIIVLNEDDDYDNLPSDEEDNYIYGEDDLYSFH